MSILVVCRNCRKSFQVSDKFAGKSGPCPNCKQTLVVPEKSEEVVVHAPQEFVSGGKTISGKLVTKPVARDKVRLSPVGTVVIVGTASMIVLVTWVAGRVFAENLAIRGVGLTLISPLLVVAAYTFLRNEDLEPYRGRSLYIRAAICGVIYAALWAVYGYVAAVALSPEPELWQWLFVVPPLIAAGGVAALACLDLDYGDGCLHYAFYVLVTVLLRWIAGIPWI